MPVDTTRVASPRRTHKKLTEEELKDIDRKRLLGELSCAECRRLKLRCDKKLPCGSCYRRGCESICPLGMRVCVQSDNLLLEEAKTVYEGAKDEAEKDKDDRIGRVVSQHRVDVDRIDAERDTATAAAVVTGRRGLLDRVTGTITSFVVKHGTTPFNALGGAHGSHASTFVATYAELLEEKLLANDPSLTDFLRKIRDVLPNYVQGLAIQGDEAAGNSQRVA